MIERKLGIQCSICKNNMIVSSKEKGQSIICPKCNNICDIPAEEAIPAEYNEEYNTKNQTLVNDFLSICPICHNHYRLPRSMHQQEMLCYHCQTIFIPSIITKDREKEKNKDIHAVNSPHNLYEKIRNSKIGHKLQGGLTTCFDIAKVNQKYDRINWSRVNSSKENFTKKEIGASLLLSEPTYQATSNDKTHFLKSDFSAFITSKYNYKYLPDKRYWNERNSDLNTNSNSSLAFNSNSKNQTFCFPVLSPNIISFFILLCIYIANSGMKYSLYYINEHGIKRKNSLGYMIYFLQDCSNIEIYLVGYLVLFLSLTLYDGKLIFFRNRFKHLESGSDLFECFFNLSYLKLEFLKTTYLYAFILLFSILITSFYDLSIIVIILGTCITSLIFICSTFSIYYLMDNTYDNELQCIKQSIKVIKDNIFYFVGSYIIITIKALLMLLIIGFAFKCFINSIILLLLIGFLVVPILFLCFFAKITSWIIEVNTLKPILYELIKD